MLALLAIFLAGRYYQLETRGVPLLGVKLFFYSLNMWAFLRPITLLWEFGSGRVERPSLLSFVIWVGLPFTLLGPVLRYSQFEQQLPLLCQFRKTENILDWTRHRKLVRVCLCKSGAPRDSRRRSLPPGRKGWRPGRHRGGRRSQPRGFWTAHHHQRFSLHCAARDCRY